MHHFRNLFMENSEERLLSLVAERIQPGADKDSIDKKVWDLFGEDWTVMLTDLSGFSRNAANFGIMHFIQVIIESERLFSPVLEEHGGFLIKREGDSLLVLFRKPQNAFVCALRMQEESQKYSRDKAPEDKVILSVGLSHGHILRLGSSEVFGEAVNSASKLGEDTASHHEILITQEFVDACENIYQDSLHVLV